MSLNIVDPSTGELTKVADLTRNFCGDLETWNSLSLNEKLQYKTVDFTDTDNLGVVIDSEVVDGSENVPSTQAVYNAIDEIKQKSVQKYKALTFNTISGVTFTKRDNNAKGLSAVRINDIIIINFAITVQGTYNGTSNWLPIFEWSQLNSLLNDGETINDQSIPYFCSGITYTNNASYNKLDGIMNGCYLYFYNTAVFNMGVQGQIVIAIKQSS